MLEIERIDWRKPEYTVRDDQGHAGVWIRRRLAEAMTGEIDGDQFELQRDGGKHFALVSAGSAVATADAAKRGRWAISVEGMAYELRRKSAWRSEMELSRGGIVVGSIRRRRRRTVLCALPAELAPAAQAFIGFVVLTLWNRDAATAADVSV